MTRYRTLPEGYIAACEIAEAVRLMVEKSHLLRTIVVADVYQQMTLPKDARSGRSTEECAISAAIAIGREQIKVRAALIAYVTDMYLHRNACKLRVAYADGEVRTVTSGVLNYREFVEWPNLVGLSSFSSDRTLGSSKWYGLVRMGLGGAGIHRCDRFEHLRLDDWSLIADDEAFLCFKSDDLPSELEIDELMPVYFGELKGSGNRHSNADETRALKVLSANLRDLTESGKSLPVRGELFSCLCDKYELTLSKKATDRVWEKLRERFPALSKRGRRPAIDTST